MAAASLHDKLLSVLACPKCRGKLVLTGDVKGLACRSCQVIYPIRDGSPVLLPEESTAIREDTEKVDVGETSEKAVFSVVEGKNKGQIIEIERGTCRAMGRSLDDVDRTTIFSVSSAVGLDENSKKLVMGYVSKQFKKSGAVTKTDKGNEAIGGFVRGPDIQVRDGAVSRLHAMIFFDGSGSVGILDLVSKNGTYINGAEVESKLLKKGDLVAIGGTKIRYE